MISKWLGLRKSDETIRKERNDSLDKKGSMYLKLLKYSTLNLTPVSEEELEYLKAHPEIKGNGKFECREYRSYRGFNLITSCYWDKVKVKESKASEEIKDLRLKTKKSVVKYQLVIV